MNKSECTLTTPPEFVLKHRVHTRRIHVAVLPLNHRLETDALAFMSEMSPNITAVIEKEVIRRHECAMFTLRLSVEFEKFDKLESTTTYFTSAVAPVRNSGELQRELSESIAEVLTNVEKFPNGCVGWRLKRCVALDLGYWYCVFDYVSDSDCDFCV